MKMRCLSNKFKFRYGLFLIFLLFQAIFLSLNVWWTFDKDSFQIRPFGQINKLKDNISTSSEKTVSLFVAILTHAIRKERRDAIRETWMSACKKNHRQIICGFFTDEVGLNDEDKKALDYEKKTNKDIVIINATEIFAFAERLLLVWEWGEKQHINYEYFLRIDDDHFLCVDRVLHELHFRPKNVSMYWGFVHCHRGVVRVDEGWLMLSRSIVSEIMEKRANKSLLCSPYGDQAVAMWVNHCKQNVTYFMDNKRIIHKSAGENPVFLRTDICASYLSLHGSYPRAMKQFWLLSEILRKKRKEIINYTIPEITSFSSLCPFSPIFDYKAFVGEYQFEPKLCHLHPTWSVSKSRHVGREETGERYSSY